MLNVKEKSKRMRVLQTVMALYRLFLFADTQKQNKTKPAT